MTARSQAAAHDLAALARRDPHRRARGLSRLYRGHRRERLHLNPGNLGWQMLFRDLGDGTSKVVTMSWWRSLDDIRAFAGADIAIARYYPEDDRFLLERPRKVEHSEVADGSLFG